MKGIEVDAKKGQKEGKKGRRKRGREEEGRKRQE